ncbi:type I glyceraldehyde-3-phosphate dehydrogenase [Bacillus sp. ISL-34]|uniref:type I glyceraldehyde-3-phosphate dehydrogenase n=1 Tax=Bacillus sp. ISL-34 TaxID=2819121 RepID=UPI001BEA5649|nr:type I glyceraldehyde-3-phosphate dehydrogenase [Bacillus sp. ISL-34]MBT2649416.1 type I glyceraldehyde-3-phosphate dehydrogenase [Bacillus sp. ISL-34]
MLKEVFEMKRLTNDLLKEVYQKAIRFGLDQKFILLIEKEIKKRKGGDTMERKIGISGTGRIGRMLVRKILSDPNNTLKLVAINSIYPADTVAHLLKYDSVHGTWDTDISVQNGNLLIDGNLIQIVSEFDPENIPWRLMNVDIVIDATGKFNHRQGAQKHLVAGASHVIVTAPGEQIDLTVVMGVNDHLLNPSKHTILSAASCTTNCVAPLLNILDQAFQVKRGWMTTVHSLTSDQKHIDNPHKDLRRARACTQSIIPTTTGVGKALVDVLPHLASYIEGISIRVPTQDVSLVDLTVQVSREVSVDEVKSIFLKASKENPYINYTQEPLVSTDFIGCDKSAIVDGLSIITAENQIKILAWYDNEWAYACRVIDLAQAIHERLENVCLYS